MKDIFDTIRGVILEEVSDTVKPSAVYNIDRECVFKEGDREAYLNKKFGLRILSPESKLPLSVVAWCEEIALFSDDDKHCMIALKMNRSLGSSCLVDGSSDYIEVQREEDGEMT